MVNELIYELKEKYSLNIDDIKDKIKIALSLKTQKTKVILLNEKEYIVTKTGIGPLLTPWGEFYQINFRINDQWKNYSVIVKAKLDEINNFPIFNPNENIYLRIDSSCQTGQLYNDQTCECKNQLYLAMNTLKKEKQGLIIHIFKQDGRGKGIDFKLATLYLQYKLGISTIEAFKLLDNENSYNILDNRTYDGVIAILKYLNIRSKITLGTNNPEKISSLEKKGYTVKREVIMVKPTKLTKNHLDAKYIHLGHLM